MADSDRPLPTPPRSRFGRDSHQESGAEAGMISDRMALAAAEGRLEEFLQHDLPDGEHARSLALMMMGMSGIVPGEAPSSPAQDGAALAPKPQAADAEAAAPGVPPEVLAAIRQGDVANLSGLLRAEHAKRSGQGATAADAPEVPAPAVAAPATGRAGIDAAVIDELIRIAAENDVTVDWLTIRAVKLYVAEHRRTGKL